MHKQFRSRRTLRNRLFDLVKVLSTSLGIVPIILADYVIDHRFGVKTLSLAKRIPDIRPRVHLDVTNKWE
jgi:hypothetical protein